MVNKFTIRKCKKWNKVEENQWRHDGVISALCHYGSNFLRLEHLLFLYTLVVLTWNWMILSYQSRVRYLWCCLYWDSDLANISISFQVTLIQVRWHEGNGNDSLDFSVKIPRFHSDFSVLFLQWSLRSDFTTYDFLW